MPRKSTYSPTCTINFQTDVRTRDALLQLIGGQITKELERARDWRLTP
jgi:hypothetical protein